MVQRETIPVEQFNRTVVLSCHYLSVDAS